MARELSKVFISYRRETGAGEARALFNDLVAALGKTSVFMDVDSLALGRDFRTALQETLKSCDLMLVVIDKDWAGVKDEAGRIRLQNTNDFVRMEVEGALKRDIAVTPVLVHGARMPLAEELPEAIRDLAYRNGFELTHNRWDSDFREMMRRLGLDEADEPDEPNRSSKTSKKTSQESFPWSLGKPFLVWMVAASMVLAGGAAGLLFMRDSTPPPRPASGEAIKADDRPRQTDPTTATPSSFGVKDYIGGWKNAEPNTRGITWISVRKEGQELVVQIWGACHPTDCDWGTAKAVAFGRSVGSSASAPINSVGVTFTKSFAESRTKLSLTAPDKLTAIVDTHFTDGSARADYEATYQFARAKTSLPAGQ